MGNLFKHSLQPIVPWHGSMKIGSALGLIVCCSIITGCVSVFTEADPRGESKEVYVEFVLNRSTKTKSSIPINSDEIRSLDLFAYCNGVLYAEHHADSPVSLGLVLLSGKDYSVYALANADGFEKAPYHEEELLESRISIDDISALSNGIPMCAKTNISVGKTINVVPLVLERLVAKINFGVDKECLPGLKVTSVRLMQSSLDVTPFVGKSAAVSVSNGDYATEQDLALINSGGLACFYTLENCQGILLPDNDDPWQKIPDNIPSKAALCTYIEVGAEFDGGFGISGNVIYRLFLGQDTVSDFNIFRNTDNTVLLTLTRDGLNNFNWKIDSGNLEYSEILYELSAAEYLGQWGKITFPEATQDKPITLSFSNSSYSQLTLPAKVDSYTGGDINDDAPNLFVTLASEPNTIYYCLGSRTISNIKMTQGMLTGTIGFQVKNVSFTLESRDGGGLVSDGGRIDLNEDGSDRMYDVYLADEKGNRLYASSFAMPEPVFKYCEKLRKCVSRTGFLYWYFDLDAATGDNDRFGVSMDSYRGLYEDEDYLYTLTLYGLMASDREPFVSNLSLIQNYIGRDAEVSVYINPAFPDQRYLGRVENLSVAPEVMRTANASRTLYNDIKGTMSASWTFRHRNSTTRYLNYEKETVEMNEWERDGYCSGLAVRQYGDEIRFTFSEDFQPGGSEFFATGGYVLDGKVTNPHSGRIMTGHYGVDIVLVLSIIAQVDYGNSDSPNQSSWMWNYVPFCKYAARQYSDMWNDCFGVVKVKDNVTGTITQVMLHETFESAANNAAGWFNLSAVNATDIDSSYKYLYGEMKTMFESQYGDFSFLKEYTADEKEMFCDSNGFYRLLRQRDYGRNVENRLIEAAYGSFANY